MNVRENAILLREGTKNAYKTVDDADFLLPLMAEAIAWRDALIGGECNGEWLHWLMDGDGWWLYDGVCHSHSQLIRIFHLALVTSNRNQPLKINMW